MAGRRLTSLPTTFLISTKHHLPTKYRSPPFFQNPPITIFPKHLPAASPSSFQTSLRIIQLIFLFPFFHFLYRVQHPPGLHLLISSHTFPTPFTSSVLLPLLKPAGQTRNVVSRAGAACKAADGAGEEPAFLFFLFFYFFLLLSFLSSFPSPWRRGFAATPSFFFLLFFIFLFFLFVLIFAFLFAFFFLIFSLYFSYYFLFLFFLCPFFLLFLSFYFCSYLCFLFFIFIFVFLLSFYFCFSFSFFCLSFCFTFLPSLLQSLSSLSNRSPTIHFFYSAANLSHSIQPLPAAAKKKKNIGKRIHGG